MGFIEFEKIINLIPDEITESEKENLFPDLVSLQISEDVELENIIKLFKISQELLKFKGEQVESLISELDNLAVKLGEEEAKKSYGSVEDFRSQGYDNGISSSPDAGDYQRKLVKMEIQMNQLLGELQEKEQELINEKKELDKLESRISVLDEENKNLKNELQATQQELASSASLKLVAEDQEYPSLEKYHELTELLKQKNKHITQLLNDIEDIEKENIQLRDQLSVVRDELSDGTNQMYRLSMERLSLSVCVDELNANVSKLKQENVGLRNQISELIIDKEQRDKQMETMKLNYEAKTQQWRENLQKKENELTALRVQFPTTSSHPFPQDNGYLSQLSELNKQIVEREEKIIELQQHLEQATIDLSESTRLLEEQQELCKSRFDKNTESNIIKQLRKKQDHYESRIMVLEAKVSQAEQESLKKAEEVTELIMQLREYESGNYGLEDAMIRLKEIQKQKQVRDSQIEQLVKNINQLQDDVNLLEQENQVLRERLGISPDEQIVVDDISRHNRDRHNKLTQLTDELEKIENELISYKIENRSLKKQLAGSQKDNNISTIERQMSINFDTNEEFSKPGFEMTHAEGPPVTPLPNTHTSSENLLSNIRLQDLIDENESLRKGMHEILDSIRNKDGSSFIQIESEILEQLLEALDSRHINGWYQPAMRLQAHIHHLNGVNQTLREELHIYRQREEQLIYELHEANQKYVLNSNHIQMTKTAIPDTLPQRKSSPRILMKSKSYTEDTHKTDNYLIEKELEFEKHKCQVLETDIEQLKDKFVKVNQQMDKLNETYDLERENWMNLKASIQKELEEAKNDNELNVFKITDYEKSLELLKQSPDQKSRAIVEFTLSISSIKMEQVQLLRKYQALIDVECETRQERNKLHQELLSVKITKNREIVELRKINEQLSAELKDYVINMSESIDRSDHENVVNKFQELTIKHRETLNKQILLHTRKDQLLLKMQNEIAVLQSQKMELETKLKCIMEEDNTSMTVTSSDDMSTLKRQVTTLEQELLTKKQSMEHSNQMFKLTKEQLSETENRCKYLETQLTEAIETNSLLQKNEATLQESILRLPNLAEFEEIHRKLKAAENSVLLLQSEKVELEELANIAQDQIRSIEHYNKHQDFEFDSLQRRILELQSHSDEKVIIDRLTKEVLSLKHTDNNVNNETNILKTKMAKLESELLQVKMNLNVSENNYTKLKRDSNTKMRCMYSILYELQKRYLGAYPLVKEELCFERIMNTKEECYDLISLLLDMKPTSILKVEGIENDLNGFVRDRKTRDEFQKFKFQMQVRDFNMQLINESLQKEIHIYAERLERKDKLIDRLEQEIIHADEQCEEFLHYWDPNTSLRESPPTEEISNTKFTQTSGNRIAQNTEEESNKMMQEEPLTMNTEITDKLNQANRTINELEEKLKNTQIELLSSQNEITNLLTNIKEKEILLSSAEQKMLNLQTCHYDEVETVEKSASNSDDENSVKKLALKSTIDSLQNIIIQKEEIIKRLQTLLKKNGEEHAQSVVQLLSELKNLQDAVDAKDQACNRTKTRLDAVEKSPAEKKAVIDSYITRIHELEDELNEANEKLEHLSSQLTDSHQQAELWSHTAEERLKILQHMKHDCKLDKKPHVILDAPKISYSSLLQIVKEKTEKVERQNQTIEELKKRLGSGEKLPGYRDRLKNELTRCKKKLEALEQHEREDKIEIQRLRNQINNRPLSARTKENLVTIKEEQLQKKIKLLEEQIEEYSEKEKKWTETRRAQIDEEFGKWESKKRHQQIQEKLRQQLKDVSSSNESLKISHDRLKETIIRLEKERMTLESKLKTLKTQTPSMSLVDELQKSNTRLEEEIKMLHRRSELSAGAKSLTDIIESQERKIKSLELAQKGDFALAEEIEKLNERKSRLQKNNVHLEDENLQLKLQIKRLKSESKEKLNQSDTALKINKISTKDLNENLDQSRENQRRNSDLEKAVLVLRRVIEKLQAENKRLHDNKIHQIQDKSQTEKLQLEFKNLQKNYLDAIEKNSLLDQDLEDANKKVENLGKLIDKLQSGEEIAMLKIQLNQKNHLLGKVKILLEKAAIREKELLTKVNDLQVHSNASYYQQ